PDLATELLAAKCGEVREYIGQRVSAPLNQNESDALISVVYSIGADAFEKSTLLTVLNAGDRAAAAAEIRKWTKASKAGTVVDVPELAKRREVEASLFARSPEPAAQGLSLRAGRASSE